MWLFTTTGFYSVVTAEEFGEELQVRARCEDDLDRLRAAHFPTLGPGITMEGRDYPWRAFTTRSALAEAMARIALDLDYSNFKNEVSLKQSNERAHIYTNVWSACRKITKTGAGAGMSTASGERGNQRSSTRLAFANRTAEYRARDLHAEGAWPEDGHLSSFRYGGVVFNRSGQVLLREPKNHFDGYHWTFSKGAANKGEHPVDTALRETLEETGYSSEVIGHVPGVFKGGNTGSANYYYLMLQRRYSQDEAAMNGETSGVRWVSEDEAVALISQSTNRNGRERDLRTLAAASRALAALTRHEGDAG